MLKRLTFISLGLVASMANAAVLVDVPGLGNTSTGCSPQCAVQTAITLTTAYDPTQTLWDQVDNAGILDGNAIIFSQGIVAATTGNATHIQWNGVGNADLGFIIGVWDLSVAGSAGKGMPGFGINFGNISITGKQMAMLDLPVNKVTASALANGMTHYDAVIPSLPITAGHNYGISIVGITSSIYKSWQWEIAAHCASASYAGCIVSTTSPYGPSTLTIMGGSVYRAAPVAFQFSDDVGVSSGTPVPAVPPVINTTSLPAATVGAAYTANVSYTVPAGDNATFTVIGLPPGLGFNTNSNIIAGYPSAIGNFNVQLIVTDSTTGLSTSSQFQLTVNDIALNFAPVNPVDATTNSAYTASLDVATGGYGAITYTASGLPTGISLSGNTLSGTPTVAGVYPITLTAIDSVGSSTTASITLNVINPVSTATVCTGTDAVITAYVARNPGFIVVNGGLNLLDHLWINNLNASNTTFNGGLVNWYSTGAIVSWTGTVDPAGCILDHLTVSPRVTVSTTSLANAVAGTAYTTPITVAWGVAPYSTSVIGLPAGLSFDGANITGTPTVAGTFNVSVSTTDALGISAASAPLTLTVSAPAISSFSASLPTGTIGKTYSGSVAAVGGYGALSYAATGLPAGLSLSGNTIIGAATAIGTYSVSFTVTDALGTTSTTNGSITINSAAITAVSATLPAATVGMAYSGSISVTGGYGALSYAATGLPAGLALSGKNITGTPTTAGSYSVSFTVTDAVGTQATTTGTITVASAPVITGEPSCTKPTGGKGGLNTQGNITAIAGNVITITNKKAVSTSITVPSCAKITWNGGATAFALGQQFEWKGYSSTATGNVAQSVIIN